MVLEKEPERRERELMRSNSERDRNTGGHSREYSNSLNRGEQRMRERGFVKFESKRTGIKLCTLEFQDELLAALDKVLERTHDFTDSAYTNHGNRQKILLLCDRAKLELAQLLQMALNMDQYLNSTLDIDIAIESVLNIAIDLSQTLIITALDQASELSHINKSGIDIVNSLRNIALNHEIDRLQECADRFHEHLDHLLEVRYAILNEF